MTQDSATLQEDAAPAGAKRVHPSYRPDIDGLRAIAVLSVMMYHAFSAKLGGGFAGVDVFFVISGYLIGSILIANVQRGTFSFRDFYARRIRRIFPALLLVLASCLAFGWFALFPDEYAQLGKHVLGGAGFVSNFVSWNEVGYFDTAAETKPLIHLWSLGIEEQFYILWPVLLFIAVKFRVSPIVLVVVAGVASFALNVAGVHDHATATFYSPLSRVWELLAGAGLAWIVVNGFSMTVSTRRHGEQTTVFDLSSPRARNVMSVVGLLLIAVAMLGLRRSFAFPGWWALLPVGGAVLLIAAGPHALVNRLLLARKPLVFVGLISYPLYLWHWPLLSFAQIIESGIPEEVVKVALLATAFVLSWLTYKLVETPLRGTRRGRAKVVGLSLTMIAIAAVGGAIWKQEGLPNRSTVVENALQQKDLIVVENAAQVEGCKRRYGFDTVPEYCLMYDAKKPPTVVLIGDSHAYHVVAGQMKYWTARGENLAYLGTRVPYFGLPDGGEPYQKATPQMLEIALKTPSVKTVVISTAMILYQSPAEKAKFLPAFRETLDRFTRAGRQVIIVADNPVMPFEPRACIRRGAINSSQTRTDCSMPRSDFDAMRGNNADFPSVLKDYPQVKVFDPASAICDDTKCRFMIDGALMYRDNNHFSYRGDLRVGEYFTRWAATELAKP